MNNVNKSEGDNSDFFGVNRSVLSPLPKLGTMGSNWGEVRVTGFLYHLKQKMASSHALAVESKGKLSTTWGDIRSQY